MLVDFLADFPDDEACLVFLWNERHNLGDDTAHCERCGEIRQFRRYTAKQQRQDWTCTACGLHVHPTAGTIFHKSSTGLHLWFYAMYLMTSTRSGISAKQLERELGVTYKTAWRIFHLIRNELMTQDDNVTLSGDVELDETYVGGKPRQSDRAKWADLPPSQRKSAALKWSDEKKITVFGMVERGGRVSARVVPSNQAKTLTPIVTRAIAPTSSTVYTDQATWYKWLPDAGYNHATIDHSARVYVSGNVHTQTIESFWSLVKRGIIGVHGAVSPKHLQGYLNECVWRFNHRRDFQPMFFTLLSRVVTTLD